MSDARRVLSFAAASCAIAWALPGGAADTAPDAALVGLAAPPSVAPADALAWSDGPVRSFVAGRVDLGDLEQVQLAAGYGKPHWTWAGIVASEIGTWSFASGALGVRAALRAVNLSASWRVTRSFYRVALVPAESHVALPEGAGITLRTLELSASGGLPAPGGFAVWETSWTRYLDAPAGLHVYDEMLRAIVDPPWAGTVRAGYVAQLRRGDRSGAGELDVGALGQWIALPGRRGSPLMRAGPVFSWTVTRHLEVNGALTFTLSGPDRLDFWREFCAVAAVGYVFASGDTAPRFP